MARAIAAATADFLSSAPSLVDASVTSPFCALRSRAWRLRSSRSLAISLLSGSLAPLCAASACLALARAIAAAIAGFTLLSVGSS
ncbi:Uncharacterised protein [Vibrio cholerae]|nr:Uncharacterised protein [Vibrio cholerae]